MGLWKIDNSTERLSPDEWNRRMMRKHSIQRWLIAIAEIIFMAGVIWAMIYFFGEVHP